MFHRSILVLVLFLASSVVQAQLFSTDLQKGFKAFEKKNYDKALELFSGELHPGDSTNAGAHYGMALVYFSKDYAGYNVGKAYTHIVAAQVAFDGMSRKAAAGLARVDVDKTKIDQLKEKIDDELFSVVVLENTPEAYEEFVRKYPHNSNVPTANEMIEQLNFFKASSGNSEAAINKFIHDNPNSKDVQKAVRIRNLLAFQKAKSENSVQAMKAFIEKYPGAEQIAEAWETLAGLEFQEAKKMNTVAAYDSFLVRYPDALEFPEATMLRNQLAYIQLLEQQKLRDSAELKEKDGDLVRQGQQINMFIVGSVVLLLLAGLLYYGYLQKKRSNRAITLQKEIIEQKNREIVDSINYAKRIQDSMLPLMSDIRKSLPELFVYFKPRDIVSGDFYWFARQGNKVYIAAADCTGHGVPGALVSMIGFNFLSELVNEKNITDPGEILNHLHAKIAHTLNKEADRNVGDGMDIALLCVDNSSRAIAYAGAVRPLYYIDEEGLKTIKGGFYSIGGIKSLTEEPFMTHVVTPKGKATFYLFSDGYADQFGGPSGKKFKMKKFQELLLSLNGRDMHEQHSGIENTFVQWMGHHEQVDDVCVIGVRV